ncbi:MAG: hypothetical protein JWO56_3527, partial [Acidobacteria bacterium]|nr:hypothetical protein [Acidobacteriota bacterium]
MYASASCPGFDLVAQPNNVVRATFDVGEHEPQRRGIATDDIEQSGHPHTPVRHRREKQA